ncbi:hypothetical protein ACFQ3S_09090 [Mucilaginibacter terrae]|uniref:hypothetical protein n=1 Tax=Mucilaginibacter terrae TaxID=1955052 RepID=UPI00362D0A36
MINPVNLTMTSGNIDRHLSINPVYLQASSEEPVMHTETFLIYEEITPYEGMTDADIFNHLSKTQEPDYDPNDELLYLGAIKFTSHERMTWEWEGKSPGFSGKEMAVLINFITKFFEGDGEKKANMEAGEEFILPLPPDTFTINLVINGISQPCTVSNWGEIFEVHLPEGYVLLSIDENLIWRQTEGVPLPASLIDEIGYKINSFYA